MSSEAMSGIIMRASADAGFRRQLVADPEGVGAASGLTTHEVDALMSGDSARLRQVGVSEELSRFTLIELPAVQRNTNPAGGQRPGAAIVNPSLGVVLPVVIAPVAPTPGQ
jgi:hypothetical protein